ncbi:unnamed protein product [Ranitomeya imitator]|uniref:PH domain-containing protein n=1 Tax=Ranitomeya imitator TaxID=111125 RepID=A0ABN9MES3_9NEOB|nr:unnamed protein product [Ranitomeya imitator]
MVVDDEEKANILNTFFSTVFTVENEMLGEIPRNNENPILRVTNLTQEEVRNRLNKIKIDKSPGPDGIHPRVLRELSNVIDKPLFLIFRDCIATGSVPQDWRIANVVPIFKKGSKSEPGNYRPEAANFPSRPIDTLGFTRRILDLDKAEIPDLLPYVIRTAWKTQVIQSKKLSGGAARWDPLPKKWQNLSTTKTSVKVGTRLPHVCHTDVLRKHTDMDKSGTDYSSTGIIWTCGTGLKCMNKAEPASRSRSGGIIKTDIYIKNTDSIFMSMNVYGGHKTDSILMSMDVYGGQKTDSIFMSMDVYGGHKTDSILMSMDVYGGHKTDSILMSMDVYGGQKTDSIFMSMDVYGGQNTDSILMSMDVYGGQNTDSILMSMDVYGGHKTDSILMSMDGYGGHKTDSILMSMDVYGGHKTGSILMSMDGYGGHKTDSILMSMDVYGGHKTGSILMSMDGYGGHKTDSIFMSMDVYGGQKTDSILMSMDVYGGQKTDSIFMSMDVYGGQNTDSILMSMDVYGGHKTDSILMSMDVYGGHKTDSIFMSMDVYGGHKTDSILMSMDVYGGQKTDSIFMSMDVYGGQNTDSILMSMDGYGGQKTDSIFMSMDVYGGHKTDSILMSMEVIKAPVSIAPAKQKSKLTHCFVINALSQRYFFQASDQKDLQGWVDALNAASKITVTWDLIPSDGIVRHMRSAALTGGARPIAAGCQLPIAADIWHYVPGAVMDRSRHINPRHTAIKDDRGVPVVQGSIAQGGGSLRASLRRSVHGDVLTVYRASSPCSPRIQNGRRAASGSCREHFQVPRPGSAQTSEMGSTGSGSQEKKTQTAYETKIVGGVVVQTPIIQNGSECPEVFHHEVSSHTLLRRSHSLVPQLPYKPPSSICVLKSGYCVKQGHMVTTSDGIIVYMAPHTVQPAPHTVHPAPHTVHPAPHTVQPAPPGQLVSHLHYGTALLTKVTIPFSS